MIEVFVIGTVETEPVFSHKAWGEKFYKFTVASARISGVVDHLPCVASEILTKDISVGDRVTVRGDLRSFKHYDTNKCEIYMFGDSLETPEPDAIDENEAWGKAYISKVCDLRQTPATLRDITDLVLKSVWDEHYAYIPSIAWGRNALRVTEFERGTPVRIDGRFQSRQYEKRLPDGETETRTAYELSLAVIEETEVEDA